MPIFMYLFLLMFVVVCTRYSTGNYLRTQLNKRAKEMQNREPRLSAMYPVAVE